ncbi:MAG: hypothetical protein K0S74_620 [Chlamydiales bacterium]|jgi:hypothetical protein|nr:hypothetical protein [Chlamydiales bacterium]
MNFVNLPNDSLREIYSYSDTTSLIKLGAVNKQLYRDDNRRALLHVKTVANKIQLQMMKHYGSSFCKCRECKNGLKFLLQKSYTSTAS